MINLTKTTGITLIELLIAIVVMSILAAVAIPSYTSYTEKSRRSDGRAALTSVALAQERYFTVNGGYAGKNNLSSLDLPSGLSVDDTKDPDEITSEAGNYVIVSNNDDLSNTFTLTATAQSSQSGDEYCVTMTLTNLGEKDGSVTTELDTAGKTNKCW